MIYNNYTNRRLTRHIRLYIGLFTIIVFCQYSTLFGQAPSPKPDSSQKNYRFDNGADSTVVRFSMKHDAVIIKAKVNGKKTFRFLLTTGFPKSMISENMAKKLDIQLFDGDSIHWNTGEIGNQFGVLESIKIGDLTWHPGQIAVLPDKERKDEFFRSFDAILGYDFFMAFPMRVNFDWKRLILFDKKKANPPKPGSAVKIDLDNKIPMKAMSLAGRDINVMIDLGTSYTLLVFKSYKWSYKLVDENPLSKPGTGHSSMILAKDLKFDDMHINVIQITFVPAQSRAKELLFMDASLGFGVLKHYNLFIDYPNSLIYFDACKGKKK